VEDVERQLFGGFPAMRHPESQSKDKAMAALVEPLQRRLVASGNRPHERDPVRFRDDVPGLAAIENVAEGARRIVRPSRLLQLRRRFHSPQF
jgi:hypothetical protein